MTDHEPYEDDDEDRAIARALDAGAAPGAVDDATLDDYRHVLSHLPFEEVAPPADLEDRMVAATLARRPAAATSLASRRRHRVRIIALSGAIAAAAAIVGFVVLADDDTSSELGGEIQLAAETPMPSGPGVRTASLEGADAAGTVYLSPDGDGVIDNFTAKVGNIDQRQWIWLVTEDGLIPLGQLPPPPPPPERFGFTVEGDIDAVEGVLVSLEPMNAQPTEPTEVLGTATF